MCAWDYMSELSSVILLISLKLFFLPVMANSVPHFRGTWLEKGLLINRNVRHLWILLNWCGLISWCVVYFKLSKIQLEKKKNQLKLGILAKDLSLVSLFQFPVSIVSESMILSLAINWKTVYWYVKHSGATAVVIPGKWMSRNKGLN